MMSKRFKYCLSVSFTLIVFAVYSQQTNENNEAVVTIVGNVPNANVVIDPTDFINSNPYSENTEPQIQQQITSRNIEPTLENGFHIRFELNSELQELNIQKADKKMSTPPFNYGASTSLSVGASVSKSKKRRTSLAERSFNAKKRLNSWLPKRKKRYHPHLCGRF
jgi:hypothetical protein